MAAGMLTVKYSFQEAGWGQGELGEKDDGLGKKYIAFSRGIRYLCGAFLQSMSHLIDQDLVTQPKPAQRMLQNMVF